MKKKINSLCFSLLVLLSTPTFSQGPGEPYHPMTAPGAKQIFPHYHTLFWKNPIGTVYNKVYLSFDSLKVAHMAPEALIFDGYPNVVYSSANLEILVSWLEYTKYYWRVVEYNSNTNTQGSVWYFKTLGYNINFFEETFDYGMGNWQIVGPNGLSNWSIVNSSNAGGTSPELRLNWTPQFVGTSFIMCNFELSSENFIIFNHFVDWYAESFKVGVGCTVNSGNTWNSVWDITPTGNFGPEISLVKSDALDDYKIGFYFLGDSFHRDYWYIDNVYNDYILTPPPAPKFMKATADSTQLRVHLDIIFSNSDSNSFNSSRYPLQIVRKTGLPQDTSHYVQIALIPWTRDSYIDVDILPNEIYTYRVRTLSNEFKSNWCNEATAYVPNIVPAELHNFIAEVFESNVKLFWSTATETNNSGFEILRCTQNDNGVWENIGFVTGFGTTTEIHHYSFIDESLQSGNYQYRLKQIDFDGTFEYSNIIEVIVDAPTIFSLEQNYPNPFNPTTKIKFNIPSVTLRQAQSDITVTLKVFDVLGTEIATLVNEQKQPGTYEVEFNVAQVSRPELSSGIYFYQLKAGSFLETKKMVLLR